MATLIEDEDGGSLRDALDAAFEQHAADDSGADAPAAAPAAEAAAPAPKSEATDAQASTAEQRERDASGRFAPKAQQGAAQAPGEAQAPATQQQGTQAAAAPAQALKAPASWTPQAREKWARLDPDVQAEVHRRESEQLRVLQQGAQARGFIEAFENVVRPYEVFIRSEGSNPLQAVQNLMQTAAEFRVGTPQRKVELVAGIIKNFGVDLGALDTFLSGQVNQGTIQQQQPQQFRDPRLDQFLAQQAQQAQQVQHREMQDIHREVQAFGEKHEFYNDVRPIMGDLIELASRRGETLDLEKAYAKACQLHDGVSTILAQRAANTAKGSQSSAAVLRAKRAASSVRDDTNPGAGAVVPKDDSVRAAIEAAIDTVGRA